MIFLGIDPGTARLGWAVIRAEKNVITPIDFGCVETDKKSPPEKRLLTLYERLTQIINSSHPECVAIEEIYFSNNAKTVISVAEARGIILLAAAAHNIPVASYSPVVVKQTITGSGAADKSQVQKMIMNILHLHVMPKLDDTADAIAIALTHAYSYKLKQKIA